MECLNCHHKWSTLEVPEEVLEERERAAKAALEGLVNALERYLGELRALRDGR